MIDDIVECFDVPPVVIQPNLNTLDEYLIKEEYKQVILGESVYIEKGFSFDGASIPWYLWPLLGHPMSPRLCTAAAIHDKSYRGVRPRDRADKLFHYVLIDHGYSSFKARLAYLAVRTFGWLHYRYK